MLMLGAILLIGWIGMEIQASFNKSTGLLTIKDKNTKKSISTKAFTGGKSNMGNVSNTGKGKMLPAPNGTYTITNNPNPASNSQWYGLLKRDDKIDDFTQNGKGGF